METIRTHTGDEQASLACKGSKGVRTGGVRLEDGNGWGLRGSSGPVKSGFELGWVATSYGKRAKRGRGGRSGEEF